jgi:hypothetical protein
MSLRSFFFGRKPKQQQISNFSPEQSGLLQRLLGQINPESFQLQQNPLYQQGQSYLQNLLSGSPEAFKAFEDPFKQQYQEEIVPQLAERFTGLNGQNSSAFRQALGESGKDLTTRLAALRGELQQGASGQALGYSQAPGNMALNQAQVGLGAQPFSYLNSSGSSGFLSQLLGGLGGGVGSAFGQFGGQRLGQRLAPNPYSGLFG